jgi:hypothetical protein
LALPLAVPAIRQPDLQEGWCRKRGMFRISSRLSKKLSKSLGV